MSVYSLSEYRYGPPERVDDGWEVSTLPAEGVDEEAATAAMRNLHRGRFGSVAAVVMARHGKLVLESYHWSADRDELRSIQSDTKSVASLLIGVAKDQGKIGSLDRSIFDYLPERYADIKTAENARITLKSVLAMNSGLDWNEPGSYLFFNPGDDAVVMNFSADPARYILSRPVKYEPGTHFEYVSGNSVLLAAVIKHATGEDADVFARRYLFEPLDIKDAEWAYSGGLPHAGGGLSLRARDLLKIGQLVLDEGRWRGTQVVSRAWIKESTAPSAASAEYAYQWWLFKHESNGRTFDVIHAKGYGGQMLYIVPELDMVLAITGNLYSFNPPNPGALAQELFQAVRD